jgi:hypothetical protein
MTQTLKLEHLSRQNHNYWKSLVKYIQDQMYLQLFQATLQILIFYQFQHQEILIKITKFQLFEYFLKYLKYHKKIESNLNKL